MSKANMGAASSAVPGLTFAEARKLTNEVRDHMEAMWTKLLTLYEGQAHTRLGYDSWAVYFEQEFGESKSQGYRMLDAARIMKTLEAHSPIGERPANEGVVRELRPLQKKPEEMAEAWDETVKKHGPKPTARQTRKVVRDRIRPQIRVKKIDENEKPEPKPTPAPKRKHKPLIGKQAVSHDPQVIEWVRDRYDHGWTRDQMVAASVNNTDGWPLPGDHLTNGGVSEIRAVIRALERIEGEPAQGKPVVRKNDTNKRLLKARHAKKNGDLSVLVDVRIGLLEMLRRTELINLVDYADDLSELAQHEFQDIYMELIRFQLWMDRTNAFVQGRIGDAEVRKMIKYLREDTAGCEPFEIELRAKRADKIERQLNNQLGA